MNERVQFGLSFSTVTSVKITIETNLNTYVRVTVLANHECLAPSQERPRQPCPEEPLPVEHHTNESFVLVSFLRCTTWATVGGWCTGPSPQVGATLPWVVCVCHHVARATLQHPAPGVWPAPVTKLLPTNLLWVGCQVACLGQAPIALVCGLWCRVGSTPSSPWCSRNKRAKRCTFR